MPKTAAELRAHFAICENHDDVVQLLEYALETAAALTAERDAARENARILAHAYTHDTRPPRCVVADALTYPAVSA